MPIHFPELLGNGMKQGLDHGPHARGFALKSRSELLI